VVTGTGDTSDRAEGCGFIIGIEVGNVGYLIGLVRVGINLGDGFGAVDSA
jgi:hypothetical protein